MSFDFELHCMDPVVRVTCQCLKRKTFSWFCFLNSSSSFCCLSCSWIFVYWTFKSKPKESEIGIRTVSLGSKLDQYLLQPVSATAVAQLLARWLGPHFMHPDSRRWYNCWALWFLLSNISLWAYFLPRFKSEISKQENGKIVKTIKLTAVQYWRYWAISDPSNSLQTFCSGDGAAKNKSFNDVPARGKLWSHLYEEWLSVCWGRRQLRLPCYHTHGRKLGIPGKVLAFHTKFGGGILLYIN